MAVGDKPQDLDDDSDPIESVVSIITEFAEWLADGAGNTSNNARYESVFTDEFMDGDARSWDEIARDFIKVYAERQARIARMR